MLYPIRLSLQPSHHPDPLEARGSRMQLDLQAALDGAYDNGNYDLDIDYRREPNPPLGGELAEWADQLLRSKRLR